jgi:squalene synthase HpnC
VTGATQRSVPAFQSTGVQEIMARAANENFPVASRVLSRQVRRHLLAIYGFARLVDELGDELPGDRLGALDWLQDELDRAFGGKAEHPLLRRLQPTLIACELPRRPFVCLIEANRVDQRVSSYQTFEQLLGYCRLSANPVGELVLGVLGLSTPERVAKSDLICTALQLTEHWQDVAEDLRKGRVYLPIEDLKRFDCAPKELYEVHAGARLRQVIAFEVTRTQQLLSQGASLIDTMHGRPRLAVAMFVAGGQSALAAIKHANYDVLRGPPRPGRIGLLVALTQILTKTSR